MPTLPDYKILTADDPIALQRRVVEHLADGWETAGGVAHAVVPTDGHRLEPWWQRWSQAVVRHPTWQD
ncbi:hypothetical protein GCM10028794_28330 [Silanimonas algicola]